MANNEETKLLQNEIKFISASNTLDDDAVTIREETKVQTEERDEDDKCILPMQKVCFGLGHIYNDLCAAVWFSYTLFYFQIVLLMDASTAGALIMLGQAADALATPSAGWAVDSLSTPRMWHFIGTALVCIGFTTMFSYAPPANGSEWYALTYYTVLVVCFQIGWALAQIAHLSIITRLARNDDRRSATLTAIRYTASVCCNVFVYVITWMILRDGSDATPRLGPEDFYKFKEIILIITSVGIVCALIFYAGIDGNKSTHHHKPIMDKKPSRIESDNDDFHIVDDHSQSKELQHPRHESRASFLKSVVTYQVSIMYMSSRLYTILNLIYMPLYLDERRAEITTENQSIRGAIASVPLMCFTASFLTSLLINNRPSRIDDKLIFALGSIISLIGCAWIAIGLPPDGMTADIYAVAVLIGVGGSGTMITSLCLTARFVNANGFNGGGVYSAVTFTDKLVSGAVVLLIQHMECGDKALCPNFYQEVLAYASGCSTLLGVIALGTLQCFNPQMIHKNEMRN